MCFYYMVFNHLIDISLKKLFTGVGWIVVVDRNDRMYNSFYWVIDSSGFEIPVDVRRVPSKFRVD